MPCYTGNKKAKFYLGASRVQKMYLGVQKVYSSGNVVTYRVSPNENFFEEVDEGESILDPTSFTPSLGGYSFLGWRADTTASADVLTSKLMGEGPVILYAVFRAPVTLTAYNGNTTPVNQSGYKYQNQGNLSNPKFTVSPAALSGWTFAGWCASSGATAAVTYSSIVSREFPADATVYGKYSQAITLSYNGNGAGGGATAAQAGIRYFNTGNYSNPVFTLAQNGFLRNYFAFAGWMYGNTRYMPGATLQMSASTALYAIWKVAYLSNGTDYCIPASGGWYRKIDWGEEYAAEYGNVPGHIFGGGGGRANIFNKTAFDVTYMTTISVRMQAGNIYGHLWAGISADPYGDGVEAGSDIDYFIGERNDFTIDVSKITGYKYFKIVANASDHGMIMLESVTCS